MDSITDRVSSVEVAGLRVAYRRAGSGPPVVLLHGGVCDSRVWRDQLIDLADEFTVVAWDAPGCGRSQDPPENFRLTDYAECLAGLLETLGMPRAHVAGHSFGGALALALYRVRPDIPRSLLLASAYAGYAGSLPPAETASRLDAALRVAEEAARDGFRFTPRTMPGLFSEELPKQTMDRLLQILSSIRPVGTRVMARALAEADLREVLPRVAVPTLLLYGELDTRAPHRVAEQLHAAIPGSRLVFVPRAGHELFLAAPDAFHTEVRRFLHQVS